MSILEGKPAPPFALAGSDGRTHSLDEYRGHTLVLYFYPKDSTPGCTKEACRFGALQSQFAQLGAVVLGVSRDSLESHAQFIEKFSLPLVLLSDPEGEMIQSYGAWGEKSMYGKTYMGIVRSTVVIGSDGLVYRHWPRVTAAGDHPDEVLDYLRG